MKVYLVWVCASYCDYGVVNICRTREEAEYFIENCKVKELVNHYGIVNTHDFTIEEREIGVPVKLEF